jgi:Ni2+-binding GTPase involved in maturation of urease and hydrogenase
MFSAVDAVVINKTDLLPYVDFDRAEFHQTVRAFSRSLA